MSITERGLRRTLDVLHFFPSSLSKRLGALILVITLFMFHFFELAPLSGFCPSNSMDS